MSGIANVCLCLLFLVTFPFLASIAQADWYDTDWRYRKSITINPANVPSDQSDFPVLINLATDSDLQSHAQPDGDDILFTASDGSTKLSHEIESYDSGNGGLVAWVKVPSLSSTANTVLYLYYDNSSVGSQEDVANVWIADYVGVWHLSEEQAGTGNAGLYEDSTFPNNNGDDYTSSTGQDGRVNGGQEFDGTGDYLRVPHHASLNLTGPMTISFWIHPTGESGSWNRIVEKGLFGYQTSYYFGGGDGTNDLTFYLSNAEVFDTADDVLTVDAWQHAAVTYASNGDATLFLDGIATPSGNYSGAIAGNTDTLYISFPDSTYDFRGYIDEVRIAGAAFSDDWIITEYNNQSAPSSFYTLGSPTRIISGLVFEDANFAGTAAEWDGGTSDAGQPNVDVELYDGSDVYVSSVTTGAGGSFSFIGLSDGSYKIRARSVTIGDADSPPAGGLNGTVPGTWPYPLPEMSWGNGAPVYGGQSATTDDTDTGDDAGPGDTYVTVTVSGGDVTDVNLGFAYNLIVNTADDGLADNTRSNQGSLRQFLKNANAIGIAGGTTANSSQFRMQVVAGQSDGPDSWWRITPVAVLPALADPGTDLDGATQTINGGDSNSRGPEVEISGATILDVYGLTLTSADHVINGLAVNGFDDAPGTGIVLDGASATGGVITGCYVGTNAVGTLEVPNFYGITLSNGAAGTVIGGAGAGEGNVISGSNFYGIRFDDAGANTTILGNRIGTNATGDAAMANSQGLYIDGGTGIVIGGPGVGEGNLISGNTVYGMNLQYGDDVTIQGNWMGLNLAGTDPLPDGGTAIYGWSVDNVTIGGSAPGEGNIIGGNDGSGISLGPGCQKWAIQGNTIGAGPLGTETNLGNTGTANIRVSPNDITIDATIGGENAGEGNLIAYAGGPGISCPSLGAAVEIIGNVIRNNAAEGINARVDSLTVAMNLIYDNGAGFDGILIQDVASAGKVYQNTIHGSGDDGIEIVGLGHEIRNNIITGSAGYGINLNGGTMTESNNDITGAATNPPNALGRSNVVLDASDLDADPLYVDVAGDDFTLTECTSPCINTGLDLGADQPDMNGGDAGNFNGPAPDMGAFETSCLAVTYAITGTVFEDADFAGTASDWDGGAGDAGQPNVDVELYDGSDVYVSSVATGAGGTFSFTGLSDGTYKIRARSATIGDADSPPAGGLNGTVPGTWPYPLPEMTWGNGAPVYGGQSATTDDTDTGDDAGPGDTYVTVTVSGGDVTDVNLGFAYNLIVNTADDGLADNTRSDQGSLRQFLKNTNAIGSAGGTTANSSEFRMQVATNQSDTTDNWWRITPTAALPAISDAGSTLNGSSQAANAGSDDNTRGPEIEIHGSAAGAVNCLTVTGGSNTISGLVISDFDGVSMAGIILDGATAIGNTVTGCYIGTDAIGTSILANFYGLNLLNGASDSDIGGANPDDGNLISGNNSMGIYMASGSDDIRIRGNKFGTNATGDAALANNSRGIYATSCSGTVIGGPGANEGNLVSGNLLYGIEINSAGDVTIQGNRIGTNQAVAAPLGNGNRGVYIHGTVTSATIGGAAAGEGNIISGNGNGGLMIQATIANVTVRGNMIGTGLTGTEGGLGNVGSPGISLTSIAAAPNIIIGGLASGEGNVVANNTDYGIVIVGDGIQVVGNEIRGNTREGLNSGSGQAKIVANLIIGNGTTDPGIYVGAAGTDQEIYHNTIHGNGSDGIELHTPSALIHNNIITGNGGYGINLVGGMMTESTNDVTDAATAPANALGRSNVALDATDLNVDPQYVDAAGDDFTLTECTSPCINAGLDLGVDQPDMNGSDPGNFNGPAPDMGAFETVCAAVFQISGLVFEDTDFAGMASDWDGGGDDAALGSVDMELYDAVDTYITSTNAAANGTYTFSGVANGTYNVRVRSATIGDADTPPAGGLNGTVPTTWPYPLPEMTWGYGAPWYGGDDIDVDDTDTGDNLGPGDTFVEVTVGGSDVTDVNFGFAYNLIVSANDDSNSNNVRSQQGTLRQFIKNANAITNGTAADSSQFHFGGGGPHTFQPVQTLPPIDDPIALDGTTQPTFVDTPEIILDGTNAGAGAHGLILGADNSLIRGLTINDFGQNGILITGDGSTVAGNFIGTDVNGQNSEWNGLNGIEIQGNGNTIGGTGALDTNLLSGNFWHGIEIRGNGNTIWGNHIGADVNGTGTLGNQAIGLWMEASVENTVVGGIGNDEGNTIAFNGWAGVGLSNTGGTGNAIRGNSIHSNGDLGIDLYEGIGQGVTANDLGDPDGGGNGHQNYPVLSSALTSGGNTTIQGSLNSTSDTVFQVDFHSSPVGDGSGYGEGAVYLGSAPVTTNGSGDATIDETLVGVSVTVGHVVTATATDPTGSTSEFSQSVVATSPPTFSIEGYIYEDVDGDGDIGDDGIGQGATLVHLYSDGGDGTPDGVDDAYVANEGTDGDGQYYFTELADGIHWVVVDSRTVHPSGGVGAGAADDVWAEQTYGSAGAATYDGTYGFSALDGELYGGMQSEVSDDATSLAAAEHVNRVIVSGSDVTGVDFGFSFNAITNTRDGGDDDPAADRTQQGTLRQFLQNSSAIVTDQSSQFAIPTTDTNYSAATNSFHIAVTGTPLPYLSNPVVLDATTQPGYDGTPSVDVDGVLLGGPAVDGFISDTGGIVIKGFVLRNFSGVAVRLDDGSGNTVQGNYIGTDVSGTLAQPNQVGVQFFNGADDSGIGGSGPGEGNLIAFSSEDGVRIEGAANVAILGNTIHDNGDLGINLVGGSEDAFGVTANDAGDADGGSNDLMNFPVITSAIETAGTIDVEFDVDLGAPLAGSYRVEFFKNPSGADPSGNGEGETFADSLVITHTGGGLESFSHSLPGVVGDTLTATCTECTDGVTCSTFGSTSEFSAAVGVTAAQPLTIVKRAFLPDSSAVPDGATLAKGTTVLYLLYVNNDGPARADASLRDVLDAAFDYQLQSIRVDNSLAKCAGGNCTAVEEQVIFEAAIGQSTSTDEVDADVVSYAAGTRTIDAGNETIGNAQLDVVANSVWALLFTVEVQ